MSNYYSRDKDGIWYIEDGDNILKCEFCASMEIAYQQGLLDGEDRAMQHILSSNTNNHFLDRSRKWVELSDMKLSEAHEILTKLEGRLADQCRPSEALNGERNKI